MCSWYGKLENTLPLDPWYNPSIFCDESKILDYGQDYNDVCWDIPEVIFAFLLPTTFPLNLSKGFPLKLSFPFWSGLIWIILKENRLQGTRSCTAWTCSEQCMGCSVSSVWLRVTVEQICEQLCRKPVTEPPRQTSNGAPRPGRLWY